MQKRIAIALLASVALIGVVMSTGCATLTKTADENANQVKASWRTDMRAMADDWNMIWLTDHETRMTRWHTR